MSEETNKNMTLSDQALGAVMMALQRSLLEQSDIVPTLQSFEFVTDKGNTDELLVKNPPNFKIDNMENDGMLAEETISTTGSD